jgi:hypothetical protein
MSPSCHNRTSLFDHLVGSGNELLWNAEAKRFGGLEIDDRSNSSTRFEKQKTLSPSLRTGQQALLRVAV